MDFSVSCGDIVAGIKAAHYLWETGFVPQNRADVRFRNFRNEIQGFKQLLENLDQSLRDAHERYLASRRGLNAENAYNPLSSDFEEERINIVGNFTATLAECHGVLDKNKRLHQHGSNAFQNWRWHIQGTEQRVDDLRRRIQFHTTKILLVIDRLSLRLLTDLDARIDDLKATSEQNPSVSRDIQHELRYFHLSWAAHAAGHHPVEAATAQDSHFAGPAIERRFGEYWLVNSPAPLEATPSLAEIFDVLLTAFEQSRTGTDQTPGRYLMLLKARWLLRIVQESQAYENARPGYYYKRAVNQVEAAIAQRVRGTGLVAYDELDLMSLPETAFHIWTPMDQSIEADEDTAAARANEEELVRLPLVSDNSRARETVIDALVPRYALPSVESPLLEIAIFSRGEENLYRFSSPKDLYAFQQALTGYEVSWDQGKIRCEFKQRWLDCEGRIQILQDPISFRSVSPASTVITSESDQSAPGLTRQTTRESSIVDSLAPTTVSFVDGGLESKHVKLPAICIFTTLRDSENMKRFAIVYFELDPSIVLMPERCDCHRPGNSCCRLSLEKRTQKRFPVRILFSERARGEPDPNSFDLQPFRLPRHARFRQLVVKETEYVLLKFDSAEKKITFERELKERFMVRSRQIRDLEETRKRILYHQDRPGRSSNTDPFEMLTHLRPALSSAFASRTSSVSKQATMPDTDIDTSFITKQQVTPLYAAKSDGAEETQPIRKSTTAGYKREPPDKLPEALKGGSLDRIQELLTTNFSSAATSGYEWLCELDDAGYSRLEMAKLLVEAERDSPCIHFTSRDYIEGEVKIPYHTPDCAHHMGPETSPQSALDFESIQSPFPPLHVEVRRQVEELCGMGGVVPSSKDKSTWNGSLIFDKKSSATTITYAMNSEGERQTQHDLTLKISKSLANLWAAAAVVQSAGLLCDSFTVLLRIEDHLELRRIELHRVRRLSSCFPPALKEDDTETAAQKGAQVAKEILQEFGLAVSRTTPGADLNYCASAAQFLCMAFLSYTQAHVGPIEPFYLDTPQQKITLLGSEQESGDHAIMAKLVELTCLADMIQQCVLAFSLEATSRTQHRESRIARYDVQTNLENCLDTWGPGYLIRDKEDRSNIYGIAIGGGHISLAPENSVSSFHWTKATIRSTEFRGAFKPDTSMRIGAAIHINENCSIDEAAYRAGLFYTLRPLSTNDGFWKVKEKQVGLQGGQYLIGNYNRTWKKFPGTTLKYHTLQQSDSRLIHFLEQSWGLQVSLCTSVARRVSLRELVKDLQPKFTDLLEKNDWRELVEKYKITEAFTQGNLMVWLDKLPTNLQQYVFKLTRTILEELQHTGLDYRQETFAIAWPFEGDVSRGLGIACRAQSCWAQILADSEDCATFAYVTPKCLETDQWRCRGDSRTWQNVSRLLVTEMSPSRPEGQHVITNYGRANAAPVTGPPATVNPREWKLEAHRTYYIKKLGSLWRVWVEEPRSLRNEAAQVVVSASTIPHTIWKRLLVWNRESTNDRIRERQAVGDPAECVIVSGSPTGTYRGRRW